MASFSRMDWISQIFREPTNTLSHAIAALLSIAGLVLLVRRAAAARKTWHVVSFAIYGTSLVALYAMSALHHALNISPEALNIFLRLDHAMIYFLIVGTYTPICLTVLRGGWGWSLFGVNWGLAAVFISSNVLLPGPPRALVIVGFVFFLVMGWLITLAWRPLMRALPQAGIVWLLLGGVLYSAGAGVLNMKGLRIAPGFGAHELWHFFVMAGSACHFWFMLKYIMRVD